MSALHCTEYASCQAPYGIENRTRIEKNQSRIEAYFDGDQFIKFCNYAPSNGARYDTAFSYNITELIKVENNLVYVWNSTEGKWLLNAHDNPLNNVDVVVANTVSLKEVDDAILAIQVAFKQLRDVDLPDYVGVEGNP